MPRSAAASAPTQRFHDKREALLDAAARHFNEQGVRGSTLAGIAASVGLVTNSVTYYYRKKEDLATACFLRAIAACDALAVAAARADGVPARVHAFFRFQAQLLADIEEGRHAALVTFHDIRSVPQPQATEVFAAYTAMFRRVRALLRGSETQHLGRADLNARGHIMLSIANATPAWIGRCESSQYAEVAGRMGNLLVLGIAGAGAAWPPASAQAPWRPASTEESPSEAFLRAATVLVNEQGYRGASVDKISARLSVTKGSFYHHNDTKQDLISACFERSFTVMRQALGHADASPGSGWNRACELACALVCVQLSDTGPLLRASATSALPDPLQRERVRLTLRRLAERVTGVLVDGMMDGSIRPIDPAIAAQIVFTAINAAAELKRWVPAADAGNVAGLYVRPVFQGLLCPGAEAGRAASALPDSAAFTFERTHPNPSPA
ncbi:MAG: TetR/AcrR family transcriptional regulator [Bacteriovorax sp.]|nr:TetR/AcrR family transcriptional regulator [Rhizobacter sp.]